MTRLLLALGALAACGSRAVPNAGIGNTGIGAASNGPACAATYAEMPVNDACTTTDASCDFAEGTCHCGPRSYCGGVAPSPATLAALRRPVWQCTPVRTDGCPEQPPTGACEHDGQQCSYGTCCVEVDRCADGAWVAGEKQCPP